MSPALPVNDRSARFPIAADLPLVKALSLDFATITLRRPLMLFGKATRLRPNVSSPPDLDFLSHLLQGAGHQEKLRIALQRDYKNFENFVRGKHAPSETTRQNLATRLGVSDEILNGLAHGQESSPLMPFFVELFNAMEGLFVRIFGTVTVGRVICPCCGGDMLHDGAVWWQHGRLVWIKGHGAWSIAC